MRVNYYILVIRLKNVVDEQNVGIKVIDGIWNGFRRLGRKDDVNTKK